MNALGIEWYDYGLIPFSNEITNLENILQPDCNYIFTGSTKLLSIIQEVKHLSELSPYLTEEQVSLSEYYLDKLQRGVFYNVYTFDQIFYKDLGLPLLNTDAEYLPIRENLKTVFDEPKFIKPSRDLKAFNGGILEAGVSIHDFIMAQNHQAFYIDEIAVIAELVNIYAEYRFFVIDGEVITGSYYRKNGQSYKSPDIPAEVQRVADDYAKLYKPHRVYTMDIAETDEGYDIIEYNCWNTSGSYACNLSKMYTALIKFMEGINVG
jgi:hypothetical protein